MILSNCPTKVALRLQEVILPQSAQLRMHELGVRPGAEASIVSRNLFGVVLNVGGSRVAIDRRCAKSIAAELV